MILFLSLVLGVCIGLIIVTAVQMLIDAIYEDEGFESDGNGDWGPR